MIYKHVLTRRILTVAILCLAVIAYRSTQLGANPSEFHFSPQSLITSTVYQEAVYRCQGMMRIDGRRHWCGELADVPTFYDPPSYSKALSEGVAEFADPNNGVNADLSAKVLPSQWIYASGLWGGHVIAHWWQSALALRTLVRYLELTHDTNPGYQTVLMRTYERERTNPFAIAGKNFVDPYGDDTAWWGLAWLEASKYELNVLHDVADARTFLDTAAYDADYIAAQPRQCGGVEWEWNKDYPPDTITGAEYATLVGGLAAYTSTPGPLQESSNASRWLSEAKQTIAWLKQKRLIDVRTGKVRDALISCNSTVGGPLTYTEGQVAEALLTVGAAAHDPSYYHQANAFLSYALSSKSGFVNGQTGILQEACERGRTACTGAPDFLDIVSWKGILMQALQDYHATTGSTAYDAFILRQAKAIVHNSISNGNDEVGLCDTTAQCQFVFYWGWPLSPVRSGFVNQATQMDAIDALTAALAVDPSA